MSPDQLQSAVLALIAVARLKAVGGLTVSEFGRRLHQNDSGGTDHGSASIALLLGDHLPAPLLGTYPSLANLDGRGDLIASISPPELYRQVLSL